MKLSIRLAVYFSIALTSMAVLVIFCAGIFTARQLESSNELVRGELRSYMVLDQEAKLVASSRFIASQLASPLYQMDVGGLNGKIAQIRSWMPVTRFEIFGPDKRVITDGSDQNPNYGREIQISYLTLEEIKEPLVFSAQEGMGVVFPISSPSALLGYGHIQLSNVDFLASITRSSELLDGVWDHLRHSLVSLAAAMVAASLLISGLISWLLSQRLVRPLVEMEHAVRGIADGHYSQRLPVTSHDEVGRLARSFNTMAEALWKNSRMLAKAQEIASVGAWEYQILSDRFRWTEQCFRLFGLQPSAVAPTLGTLLALVAEEDRERVARLFAVEAHGNPGTQGAHSFRDKFRIVGPGGERTLEVLGEAGIGGGRRHMHIIGTFQDITERKLSEDRLSQLANYDPLTGLPNRYLFKDRLSHAMLQADRLGTRVALMFIDLDRFKNVNDSLGHAAGDILLGQVAQRLQVAVREGDTVSRIGGDEFTLIVENLADNSALNVIANKLIAAFAMPFRLGPNEVYISPSIGITVYPTDGRQAAQLLKNADSAMYQAKEQGRNTYHFFTEELNQRLRERLELETALHGALARGEFRLVYQPQMNIETWELTGFEVLLRWRDAAGRTISPAVFVPVLEDTGMILEVGEWVLRHACDFAARWGETHGSYLTMAVNLSAKQFHRTDLEVLVRDVLMETRLPPEALKLEITESALVDAQSSIRVMEGLRRLGVGLAIDDFGTGFSSLSYLKSFPIDTLKIDQSFVGDICQDQDDAKITQAIIGLSRGLSLNVIAEGVETVEQLEFLLNHGCQHIQGYLLSRPLEQEAVAGWVRQLGEAPPVWCGSETDAKVLAFPLRQEGLHHYSLA